MEYLDQAKQIHIHDRRRQGGKNEGKKHGKQPDRSQPHSAVRPPQSAGNNFVSVGGFSHLASFSKVTPYSKGGASLG